MIEKMVINMALKSMKDNFLSLSDEEKQKEFCKLLDENQELKEKLDKFENPEDMTLMMMWCTEKVKDENTKLKEQIKEWEHHLKCSKEMLDIQGQKGNYDYDEYMLGIYNGMEYIIALFETREPNYINGKDIKFTSNKTQQKRIYKVFRRLSRWSKQKSRLIRLWNK